jgi:hypothetical protein
MTKIADCKINIEWNDVKLDDELWNQFKNLYTYIGDILNINKKDDYGEFLKKYKQSEFE